MKYYTFVMLFLITGLLSPICTRAFAEDKVVADDYPEIVDIVYEWSPEGNAIQVGDHLISSFKTVWSDNGNGEISRAGRQNIKTGSVVKVYLVKNDENGFWTADRIVILSGNALASAVQSLPENKKLEFENYQENTEVNLPSKSPSTPAKKPVFENGAWKN